MRHFYYLECNVNQDKVFKYLDEQVNEGYINYITDEDSGIIKIKNISVENDDDIYKVLYKWDMIEDDTDEIDEDFDDFHNEEDYEN